MYVKIKWIPHSAVTLDGASYFQRGDLVNVVGTTADRGTSD